MNQQSRLSAPVPDEETPDQNAHNSNRGGWSLLVSTTLLACVWLVVLPWAAERPQMKSYIHWLDQQGIDPAAMYYTELEVMETILQRQRSRQRDNARRTAMPPN